MAVTEGEYPLIIYSYLMNDMFTNECIEYAVECCRIHLFGIDENLLELVETQRLSFLEKTLNVTSMNR